MTQADREYTSPPTNTSAPIRPIVDAVLIAIIMVSAAAAGFLLGGLQ